MVDDEEMNGPETDTHAELSLESEAELTVWLETLSKQLGVASLGIARWRGEQALVRAQRFHKPNLGPYGAYARATLRHVRQSFFEGQDLAALRAEHEDSCARERARAELLGQKTAGGGVEAYFRYTETLLLKAMRTAPKLWKVAGLTPAEVVNEIFAAMLTAMTNNPVEWDASDEKPGKVATRLYAMRVRKRLYREALREKKRTEEALRDLVPGHPPTPLDLLLKAEEEGANVISELFTAAKTKLTRIQLKWLQAIEADVAAHGKLNLSRVAETFPGKGKNRSSASRALAAIKAALREVSEAANDDVERPVLPRASAGR